MSYSRPWGWKANTPAARESQRQKRLMDDMQKRQRDLYNKRQSEFIQEQSRSHSQYLRAESSDRREVIQVPEPKHELNKAENLKRESADDYAEFLLWRQNKRNEERGNIKREVQQYSSNFSNRK